MALDIDPRPAMGWSERNGLPEGVSVARSYGVDAGWENEYVWCPELSDWVLPHVAEQAKAAVVTDCPLTKKNGYPCAASPTSNGLCAAHSKLVGLALGRLLAGER